MKMRSIIVDDEPLARRRIRSLLRAAPDIEVVAECGDGRSAVAAIEEHEPDLVFLDVQMPELNGFEVLKAVQVAHLPIILFVTAYDRYALKAFEAHAVDYLLKPFKRQRFFEALEHAKEHMWQRTNTDYEEKFLQLLGHLHGEEERLVIRSRGHVILLRFDEIDWIEAAANYVRLHTGQVCHTTRAKLSEMENRLNPEKFARIHRSIIVNIDQVRELQSCGSGEYVATLRSGRELPVGRCYFGHLDRILKDAIGGRRGLASRPHPAATHDVTSASTNP